MSRNDMVSRRDVLVRGGAAAAGVAMFPSEALAVWGRGSTQEAVVPWIDRPDPAMAQVNVLDWEGLDSWITPTEKLFRVGHYGSPVIAESDWSLELSGRIDRPATFSLADIRARPRHEVVFALECAGNRGFPGFIGAVHNARWAGARLADVLNEAGVSEGGIEVVFFGSDEGEEEIRETTVTQNFARSMSLEDAMDPNVLLCYEVNGVPLPNEHGFPLRLVAPGWYGVANVKWLKRIEIRDTRYMGRFMGRDYVTLREEVRNGETVWAETSVGRTNINSVPAKVMRTADGHRIHGAAWGAAIARVEVRIDDGPWRPAELGEGRDDPYTWTFWQLNWDAPTGEHTITSRAIGVDGEVQPAADDPLITNKKTYWESNGQLSRAIHID